MIKAFKMIEDNLHVIVNNEDIVFIPNGKEQEEVGKYTQETVQIIKKDKIHVLKTFIETEKVNAEKQLKQLKEQYEPIKDLQDIDDKILRHCKLAIEKGTKAFKESMKPLNQRIVDLGRKNGLKVQIEYITKQLKEVTNDLDSLNEISK